MVEPPLRTKSIGFKVSEEEYATGNGGAGRRSDAGGVVPRGGADERPGDKTDRAGRFSASVAIPTTVKAAWWGESGLYLHRNDIPPRIAKDAP
jgi:hypothetical protein